MSLKLKDQYINCLEKDFALTKNELKRIIKGFLSEMSKGLSGKKSSLKMLPTFVDIPSGKEKGKFLALDLGGTNLRVLKVELKGKGRIALLAEKRFVINKNLVRGSGRKLFDFIARCVRDFCVDNGIDVYGKMNMGFTFSFPVRQTAVARGKLLHWTKDFSATGVVGKDVVKFMNDSTGKMGLSNIRIAALVNDTVGTLVARAYKDPSCDVALILGTGTNACYREDGEAQSEGMIINIEWGGFDKLRKNRFDVLLDKNSANHGQQILEKMVSGMYLGEISRLIVEDCVKRKILFGGSSRAVFQKEQAFKSEFMSEIESDRTNGLLGVGRFLKKNGIWKSSLEDRRILQSICRIVSKRGARIAAASLSAVMLKTDPSLSREHTVACDGSLYEKHPSFKKNMVATLYEIFGNKCRKIKLVLVKDGSGRGAAIASAIAVSR